MSNGRLDSKRSSHGPQPCPPRLPACLAGHLASISSPPPGFFLPALPGFLRLVTES